ncbi:MAG TPA: 2Fe-2S iron-sulfur cluster-binding protein [Cyclobacteriaceae bacterium]
MPRITVTDPRGHTQQMECAKGERLRSVLIKNSISPYTSFTQVFNCGGNGICATCGVFINEAPVADHWHDKLAKKFHYPRLSCQINVMGDITVIIPKKWVWGKRKKPAL